MAKTLCVIGDVAISDRHWAMQGWPAMSRGRVFKDYQYSDGTYGTRQIARKAPTMTIVLIHAPGYRFDTGQPEDPAPVAGVNWLSEIKPVVELDLLEEPQPVSIGDVDFGDYWVERVDVKPSTQHLKGGNRGGLVSSVYEVIIGLKASVDELTVNG